MQKNVPSTVMLKVDGKNKDKTVKLVCDPKDLSL